MERWFKDLDDFATKCMAAGMLLIGSGSFFNFSIVINVGIGALGAGIAAMGANALLGADDEAPPALPAQMRRLVGRAWSVLILAGGFLVMGYGILALLNPAAPIPLRVRHFFETAQGTAVLVLGGGMLGALFAVSLIFEASPRRSNFLARFLLGMPGRIYGALLLLICLLVMGLALLEIFAPAAFDALLQMLWQALGF